MELGPPESADDPAEVERIYELVRGVMQKALDELVAEGGFGVRARIASLTTSAS